MTAEAAPPPAAPEREPYPVRLEIERQEKQSRLTNFPLGIGMFIRAILIIPNYVVLYLLGIVASVVYLIATFAILFTGRYPEGMFNFFVGVNRWSLNVSAYLFNLNDTYPAFSTEEEKYPASYSVDYPERLSRILNFPFFGMFIKAFLAIPNIVVLYLVFIVAYVLVFIAQFAILFTGSFPEGMHKFVVGALRWQMRTSAYLLALTDRYPPFSLS